MIEKVEMYSAYCDGCKEVFETGQGWAAMFDPGHVEEEIDADNDWHILEDDRVYCPGCHEVRHNADTDNFEAYDKEGKFLGVVK